MTFAPARQDDHKFMDHSLVAAKESYNNGGIPVGAVLVRSGAILASGCNRSMQTRDPTSHGETDCLRNAGLLDTFDGTTLYTTLSPCAMCAGAVIFLRIPRLVVGERQNYGGDLEYLVAKGVEVTLLNHLGCIELLGRYIDECTSTWNRITSADAGRR